jgi:hydrogenase nickel incorporation protein HypA/HybF
MHELGIVIEIVKTVEDFVEKNHLSRVDTLVLQIGKMAPIVPQYIEQCYPAAVDGTSMESTKLVIEILSGKEFMIKEIIAY